MCVRPAQTASRPVISSMRKAESRNAPRSPGDRSFVRRVLDALPVLREKAVDGGPIETVPIDSVPPAREGLLGRSATLDIEPGEGGVERLPLRPFARNCNLDGEFAAHPDQFE